MPKIVVIGAGLTGLSLGYFLEKDYVILEKERIPGGLCRSVKTGGYTFDYSGHFIHLHKPRTKELIDRLLKNNLSSIERDTWIYTHSSMIPFPFQANLYYLPEKIRKECLGAFIKRPKLDPKSFYGWAVSTFGRGITKYFLKPYNEKLWTVSSRVLSSDWAAPFVPVPSIAEITKGALGQQDKRFGYNASFYYPRKGGVGSLIDSLAEEVKNLRTGADARKIDPRSKFVETADGRRYHYESLVSTQPLAELLDSIEDLPNDVRLARKKLTWNSVVCMNVGVKLSKGQKELADGKHWIYFPEKKYPFYRAGFYGNIMPSACPAGRGSMYIEASYKPRQKINTKALVKESLRALQSAGILSPENKTEAVNILDMRYAYVIYDLNRKKALETIMPYLRKNGIHSIGRYGAWEYSFMEKNILDAEKLAAELSS